MQIKLAHRGESTDEHRRIHLTRMSVMQKACPSVSMPWSYDGSKRRLACFKHIWKLRRKLFMNCSIYCHIRIIIIRHEYYFPSMSQKDVLCVYVWHLTPLAHRMFIVKWFIIKVSKVPSRICIRLLPWLTISSPPFMPWDDCNVTNISKIYKPNASVIDKYSSGLYFCYLDQDSLILTLNIQIFKIKNILDFVR